MLTMHPRLIPNCMHTVPSMTLSTPLQYFYGVTFVEDENSLMTEDLTMEEFLLLVEYSESLALHKK
ncbi:hypothetical protein P4479_26285, partial [Brevibacillus agri]|uniref:hypothetical protein n=1 Tax=Brevibacillus agri TaxID=51101 RepID=UPI002E233BBE|nr:hypothetical protein [Brevibacillus agri]